MSIAILDEISSAILKGDRDSVQENVGNAIKDGIDPERILNEGMIAAMKEVGRRFEERDIFVPEMLISARAMQGGLAIIKPYLQMTNVKSAGVVVLGTVRGDIHDIGKNLVSMMLEGAGFQVKDLGKDVAPEAFVKAVQEGNVDIIGLSALLTTTMPMMKSTIEALDEAGLRQKVKVIIGGAPISEDYAQLIGADGFAPDASRAVTLAKSLLNSR